ncbi:MULTISPECIES: CPBP family intramembrane glutamic endopeptidase [unclassified Microbulbifer]|uniref:CPBP family intramembrane glutamic endopeptidase n=1 Tax=unclassified Microbulbifer TaxID=2619833 RepID=UPI0027E3B737|nr:MULTISPECIES: CPBP family intramembrane glutamic endopeptidase [unclassified Microbulbifer]
MEIISNENSHWDTTAGTEKLQPRTWRAAGWLCVFALLHFVGVFLYIAGYGGYLGAQLGTQGQVVDPAAIQAQIETHIQSPAALVGMYMTQFCLLLPAVLLVAHFRQQSRWETLAVRRFPLKSLATWLPALLVFLAAQALLAHALDIDPGEFMKSLAGSRFLPLALMMVVAAPLLEELVFRGYLFRAWRHTRLGLSGTLLLTSVLFTALHFGQYHWVQLSFIFALSLLLGLAREKSGSVLLPILLHAGNNLASAITVIYLGMA